MGWVSRPGSLSFPASEPATVCHTGYRFASSGYFAWTERPSQISGWGTVDRVVVATTAGERVRGEIDRLVHRGLGSRDFALALARSLRRAVPYDGVCVLTIDPATHLPTSDLSLNALPADALPRLTEIEIRETDYNKFTFLTRSGQFAASLSDVTAGDLEKSLRQRELRRPNGFEDELRAVFSDATGTWGALTLLRETKGAHFTSGEVGFIASLAGTLARGLRSAMLLGDRAAGRVADDTGLLVLAPDNTVEMTNGAADRWLDELRPSDKSTTQLPTAVRAVASRTRRIADHEGGESSGDAGNDESGTGAGLGVATVRARACTGRWVVVRGSLLGDGTGARVAVLLEAARPPEMAPLIADAYGLTERERRVTELVAKGLSTTEIAEQLHLSAYTVQDHLKSIFDKSGTGSRGDLVARLFFDYYAPRLAATTNASDDYDDASSTAKG